MAALTPLNIGFLSILEEEDGYLGGYLVTNNWGRPLEFRLSTAVKPNPVQKILYADTLKPYLFADLIGKTLVEKTGIAPQLVIVKSEPALELRHHIDAPVLWLTDEVPRTGSSLHCLRPGSETEAGLYTLSHFAGDLPTVEERMAHFEGILDLKEPFERIGDAIAEARKMGVTSRAG